LSAERRWMAAVLACGEGAALSYRSAGALWGILTEDRSRVDVSVRRPSAHRRPGIRARSRPSLPSGDVVIHNWIPVTQPRRTLLDLATELRPGDLERAINEADKRDLIDPESLREALDAFRGQPGVRALRRLLELDAFLLSDSQLEVLFRPIAEAAGLPAPRTKAVVGGFEVDFFWPDLGLIVETDGLRYHRTSSAQGRDRLRDQTHTAAGLTPLRFTHRQVKYQSGHVKQVLSSTVDRLRRGPVDFDHRIVG
jgi:hypothetical protein